MGKRTLKRQIIIISGILILATILLYFSVIFMMHVFVEKDMKLHNESMTKIAVDQIDDMINLPLNLIKNVDRMVANHPIEGSTVTEYLETIQLSYPYFEEIHLISNEGMIVNTAPYDSLLIGNSVKFEPFYVDFTKEDKNYHWSEIYISSNTGNPTISVTFKEDDYLIAADLDLDKLPMTLVSEEYFNEVYSISILDKWGSYIVADDEEKVAERQRFENFDQIKNVSDGQEWYEENNTNIGIKKLDSLEWYLIFEFDMDQIYQNVRIFSLMAFGVWAWIIILIGLMLKRYFTRIDNDINELKNKTHSVVENNSFMVPSQPLRYEELEGFNQDFNYMLGVVKKRESEINQLNSHLDALVKARTGELENTNKKLEDEVIDRRKAEEQTRKLNENLDRKVKERTEELEFLNGVLERSVEKAEEANEAKSRFLSIMSHEMRTPLNGIKGFLQMLKRTRLDNEQREIVSVVVNSSDILLELINDILDVEKYAAGKMIFIDDFVDLGRVIPKLIEPFKIIAGNKDVSLVEKVINIENLYVKIDKTKFEQLFNNLLSNAVKFTEAGEIRIEIKAYQEKQRIKVEFAVADSGIGIREKVKPFLFKPFSQADGEIARSFGGTGLGLTICKEIVSFYHGRIDFVSEYGKGSKFYGYIFLEPVEEKYLNLKEKIVENNQADAKNEKVLVAEDNSVNQKLMKKFFEKHQVDYLIVNNGQEAVEACKNENISLILMDYQMPIMDGLEATKAIRKEYQEEIRIIGMTAYAAPEDRKRCLAAGMNGVIVKPVDLDELEKLLGLKGQSQVESEKETITGSVIEEEIRSLMKKINFDYETTFDLIHTFINQLKQGLNEMEILLEKGDDDTASKKAHQLKGASAAVRIETIRSRIEKIEVAIKEGDLEMVSRLIREIRDEPIMTEEKGVNFSEK